MGLMSRGYLLDTNIAIAIFSDEDAIEIERPKIKNTGRINFSDSYG
jgi:hypothetical protein